MIEVAAVQVGTTDTNWRRYENDEVWQPKRSVVLRIAQRFNEDLNGLLEEAHWPPMSDPASETRRETIAAALAELHQMPIVRLQVMPSLVRSIAAIPQ